MTLVLPLCSTEQVRVADVGSKARSLMRLLEADLPVPPGAVLTAAFFADWFDEIKASTEWAALAAAQPAQWPTHCAKLKKLCPALTLAPSQQQALADLGEMLAGPGDGGLLAVRSSSPEEDLASASFAGSYETSLGVRPENLLDAIRRCFASMLDERVFIYKKEHGFDVLSPRVAVVVQRQINSEVAGVGFSLNPLTNDFDEAVIDANWGQGESVVAGLVSPDHFVVDKVSRRVAAKRLGAKQLSIWLEPSGGTSERTGHRSAEYTLDDAQLAELTDAICRVETLFKRPVDIEWAYAAGRLHLLQARPITTYVPLPPEMLTRPGERRRVYTDIALTSGFTINAPISPMGLDWIDEQVSTMVDLFVGRPRDDVNFEDRLWFFAGSRMYQNLSNAMWLASPRRMAKGIATSDPLMAETLAYIDAKRYRAASRPSWARLRMLGLLARVTWRLRRVMWNTFWSLLAPERAHREYQRRVKTYEAEIISNIDYSLTLDEFRRTYLAPVMRHIIHDTMSALAAGLAALALVDRVVGKRKPAAVRALAEKLKLGFSGNVVAEMGIALFRLGKCLKRSDFDDGRQLAQRIENREMPAGFLSEWDSFLSTFGCRGPMEMDLASPRYADDVLLALRQMSPMADNDEAVNPEAAQRRSIEARHRAYKALMDKSAWPRRLLLGHVYAVLDRFAGTRDTPKHHNLRFHQAVRQRVLIEGRRLVEEGRLDIPEQIFDLTFADVESARDSSIDLRRLREERTRFLNVLKTHVKQFPGVIDSRGRILRPPRREGRSGELIGVGLSPGVATGPVRVLHDPHEKPVRTGDVLVAYTTDPGWTPLFTTVAAVVLELGGVLQHGVVVAREYGKPCVAGIDQVMAKLQDGQWVEVNGTTGVIRLLPPGAERRHGGAP